MPNKRPYGIFLSEAPKTEVVVVNNGNGIEMIEAGNDQQNYEYPMNEANESVDGEIASTSLQDFSALQYINEIINPPTSAMYSTLQSAPAPKKRRLEYDNLRQLLEEGKVELQPMKKSETFVKWVVEGSSKLAVYCEVCNSFLSKNSGGSLTEHVRACKAVLNPQLLPSVSINPEQKKYFLEKTVDAIAKNLLPKSYVLNDGFIECIQAAINIGYNSKKSGFGPPNSSELVANEKAIDHFFTSRVEKHVKTLYAKLRENLKANGGAISIDMKALDVQCACCILHCFDAEWNFQAYPLDLFSCDDFNFLFPMQRLFTRLDIPVDKTPIVSDRDSEAIKKRIPCAATVLENVCEHSLKPKILKLDLPTDVIKCAANYLKLLTDLEDVVGAIRDAPTLNDKLDVSFKYEVKWMSQIIMVKKFLLSSSSDFEMIEDYFKGNNYGAKFYRLKTERNSFKEFLDVFKPFLDAVKKFESLNHPTLQFVLPTLDMLQKHLETESILSNSSKSKLAKSALATMEHFKKVLIKPEHSFALCLDPLNKAELYKILGASVFQTIKQLFEKEIHKMDAIPIKEEASEFNPFTSINFSLPAAVETELNLYYCEKVDQKNYNIVTWWKNNAKRFPAISNFAKRILSIPATCALMDQIFGSLNAINQVERSDMKVENFKNFVLYRSIILANLE
uniref:HAT C-terminal dimerisation domain-containing protein n=1 Tax=Panagrolaimus sp. PS1159 TaxID=55785 RepID=A0AC35G9F8_9BILA